MINVTDTVRKLTEAINAGKLEDAIALYEPHATMVAQPGQLARGTAALRVVGATFRLEVGDLNLEFPSSPTLLRYRGDLERPANDLGGSVRRRAQSPRQVVDSRAAARQVRQSVFVEQRLRQGGE